MTHKFILPTLAAQLMVLLRIMQRECYRRPFLRDKVLREELHRYLGGILTNLDCQPITTGGVEDHVHLLCAFVARL